MSRSPTHLALARSSTGSRVSGSPVLNSPSAATRRKDSGSTRLRPPGARPRRTRTEDWTHKAVIKSALGAHPRGPCKENRGRSHSGEGRSFRELQGAGNAGEAGRKTILPTRKLELAAASEIRLRETKSNTRAQGTGPPTDTKHDGKNSPPQKGYTTGVPQTIWPRQTKAGLTPKPGTAFLPLLQGGQARRTEGVHPARRATPHVARRRSRLIRRLGQRTDVKHLLEETRRRGLVEEAGAWNLRHRRIPPARRGREADGGVKGGAFGTEGVGEEEEEALPTERVGEAVVAGVAGQDGVDLFFTLGQEGSASGQGKELKGSWNRALKTEKYVTLRDPVGQGEGSGGVAAAMVLMLNSVHSHLTVLDDTDAMGALQKARTPQVAPHRVADKSSSIRGGLRRKWKYYSTMRASLCEPHARGNERTGREIH